MAKGYLTAERLRRVLGLAAFIGLVVLFYLTIAPFIPALVWSVILAVSLWPVYAPLAERLASRPGLASALMTCLVGLVIITPFVILSIVAASEARSLVVQLDGILSGEDAALDAALRDLPYVGEGLHEWLLGLRQDGSPLRAILEQNQPEMLQFSRNLLQELGRNVFQLLVCLFATYFLFRHGEILTDQLRRGVYRLGGEDLEHLLENVRRTVRAVVYGLVMTAIAQGIVGAFGFWLGGVPYPLLFGAMIFVVSFIPFGPPFVWIPAAVAVFAKGDIGWGIFLLVWGAGVISMMDNVLRPLFIGQATKLPILLVFIGVLGGIMSFGMMGLFVGPVVLAVVVALWHEWIRQREGEGSSRLAEMARRLTTNENGNGGPAPETGE